MGGATDTVPARRKANPENHKMLAARWVLCGMLVMAVQGATASEPLQLTIDPRQSGAAIRPLHGVNSGPRQGGGTLDLSPLWKEAAFPVARLHDCHWPNPDVVDLHVLFPNPMADPEDSASYDFARTDEFVRAVHETGAAIVFRLGESIEHSTIRKHVHPPADPERWTQAAIGVIRHYTEGWANGFRYPIQYWEIWNEPDNRPAMWSGTDDDFLRLYSVAGRGIKNRFPHLKVGGPAIGNTGELEGEELSPPPFLTRFLKHCRETEAPLDFFSWHHYGNDPTEPARRGRAIRRLLDANGFPKAESHLNEWNYLPDNDWSGMLSRDPAARRHFFERAGNAEGGAYCAAALIAMQDASIDVANLFTAEANGFGPFDVYGGPRPAFFALRAFGKLAAAPVRRRIPVVIPGTHSGLTALAARSDGDLLVFLSRTTGDDSLAVTITIDPLPWSGPTECSIETLDESAPEPRQSCETTHSVTLEVPRPAVVLLRFFAQPGR